MCPSISWFFRLYHLPQGSSVSWLMCTIVFSGQCPIPFSSGSASLYMGSPDYLAWLLQFLPLTQCCCKANTLCTESQSSVSSEHRLISWEGMRVLWLSRIIQIMTSWHNVTHPLHLVGTSCTSLCSTAFKASLNVQRAWGRGSKFLLHFLLD